MLHTYIFTYLYFIQNEAIIFQGQHKTGTTQWERDLFSVSMKQVVARSYNKGQRYTVGSKQNKA